MKSARLNALGQIWTVCQEDALSEFANEKRGMNHNHGEMHTPEDARSTGQPIKDKRKR